jgi:dTDP-4-dehydrorhamnose reductase
MPMRLLVFGANGQVGHELCRLGGLDGVEVVGLSHEDVDITRPVEVDRAIVASRCHAIINAAAFTAVERAEADSETAYAVNRDGAANVARAAARYASPIVQLSTDYVFDGSKQAAYLENDPVAPLGVYGASKEAGEQAVRTAHDRHIILRTSWVFGTQGHNFVKTMLRLAREREEIGLVDDQWGCPTPAGDLAMSIVRLCHRLGPSTWGTYHFCGAGRTTWFGFAREIFNQRARITGAPLPSLRPLTTAEYPTDAPRPANSALDCSRFAAVFAFSPRPWREGLATVLEELLT